VDGVCEEIFQDFDHQVDSITGLSEEELINIIGEYEGMVVRSATQVTASVLEAGSKLRIVGRAGTGTNNIDIPTASKQGVLVMNTPGERKE